ncbi:MULTISPECIES: HNH endonuclease signature motif containing protein [Pseudomonas]|uniref:HNH nuclease domain-containing protein n=1 Tax=Pseudomonas orientalis TaxID=76758 RepID=A0A8B3XZT3_9PSED|nr:HNH endonuclease signature motif containing protein [Pseudomonas viridiflava]SDU15905.1 hypothetical protein SAMN04490197_3377 [Pseudomonas orientalis]
MPFKADVRLIAAARTGGICANPRCSCYLLGPGDDGPYQVDVFEAAHIISGASKGPRYKFILDFDYDHISNCIPLCRSCHRLIDHPQNWKMYTVEVLQEWKFDAEEMARMRRNKPINVPFFDPNTERGVRRKFAENLGMILDSLWDHQRLLGQGILSQSAYQNICRGSRGFSFGEWGHNHPDRSHDARIAYRQDGLVATMERLTTLLYQRRWARYTWLEDINFCSFRESRFSNLDSRYTDNLNHELQILIRQAHDFRDMP